MPLSTDEQLNSLADIISGLQWRYDVWDALDESKNKHANVKVLNKYIKFFRAVECGLFDSYIVSCYQLLETRRDTVSFTTIKKSLLAEGIKFQEIPGCIELEKSMKVTWLKISKLRNEYVGHLTNKKSISKVYADASLKPDEVRKYINNAKQLINAITLHRSSSTDGFQIRGIKTTEKLLEDLKCLL